MTRIGENSYWDGGLFDNTPLGAVLDRLDPAAGVDRTVYVVNLFPNEAPIPRTLLEVSQRMQNLQFANKSAEDLKLMRRFDQVAALMEALENFRSLHFEFAATYIFRQAQTDAKNPHAVGTGGTPFMQYLKKHRDETALDRVK